MNGSGAVSRGGPLLVTGAGGWIGQALVDAARRQGIEVRAQVGVRRAEDVPGAALVGATVVHLAAIAHRQHGTVDAQAYIQANADFPVALAAHARRAGARRMVFVSSAAVMGGHSSTPWQEQDVPDPHDAYAAAKLAAETHLARCHQPGVFEVCVLRPPLVWGPGVRANFLSLLRWSVRGWPLPLACATAPRSMVYRDNLVSALLHLSTGPAGAGGVFFVRDEADWSVCEWVTQIRAACAQAPRLFAVSPAWAERVLAGLGRRAFFERIFCPAQVDDRALRATGWQPPVTMAQGLCATLAWLHGGTGLPRRK
jgi:nucleoside-diphosphate-sugar epimerase